MRVTEEVSTLRLQAGSYKQHSTHSVTGLLHRFVCVGSVRIVCVFSAQHVSSA